MLGRGAAPSMIRQKAGTRWQTSGRRVRSTGSRRPPPAASGGDDMFDQLTQLAELRDKGILTDDEFAQQKARIVAG
jgi:hypothetical protein